MRAHEMKFLTVTSKEQAFDPASIQDSKEALIPRTSRTEKIQPRPDHILICSEAPPTVTDGSLTIEQTRI